MHMRHVVGCLLVLSCLAPVGALGQDGAKSPDLQRLNFYVGRWSKAGQMREDPTKPSKPISGSETCKWAAQYIGGQALLHSFNTEGAA
jgi:hypothetical protein